MESKDTETTENLYLEGDNLEILKLLRNCYYNGIKMIYIDPPYNTGNDFIYKDDFSISSKENDKAEGDLDENNNRLIPNQKSSGKYHSNWLNMMYPRLRVAKDLLANDGVIFISIGESEVDNLKRICNEIYGEENFIVMFSRLMKSGGAKGRFYTPNIDYILAYAKNIDSTDNFRTPLTKEQIERFYNKTETEGVRKGEIYGEERLYKASLDARPNQRYYIECPDGSFVIPPGVTFPEVAKEGFKVTPDPTDGVWKWTYDRYATELKAGNIVFKETSTSALVDQYGKKSKWNIYNKLWLKDQMEKGVVPSNFISNFENRQSSAELKALKIPFDYAKPVNLIKYLMGITGVKDNDIVLDFFSGSATTAHAVMKFNSEDNGKRRYIMVQIPEKCEEESEAFKAGYKNICEIGKERIRRAGELIKEESKDKQGIENLDFGFKVFKIANTNIRWFSEAIKSDILDYDMTMTDKDQLDFNPGFTDIDVVYEILLRHRDIPLSTNVEQLSNIGRRTYIFADTVVVCLEEMITEEMINKIAAIEPMPTKIIFRDSAFGDDISLKENTMIRLEAQMRKNSGLEKRAYRVEFI